jgi:hypothetical protein
MTLVDLGAGILNTGGVRIHLGKENLKAHHFPDRVDLKAEDYVARLHLREGVLTTPGGPRDLPSAAYDVTDIGDSTLLLESRTAA